MEYGAFGVCALICLACVLALKDVPFEKRLSFAAVGIGSIFLLLANITMHEGATIDGFEWLLHAIGTYTPWPAFWIGRSRQRLTRASFFRSARALTPIPSPC
jgi:hypothetical protein